jgi:hypothetical protein
MCGQVIENCIIIKKHLHEYINASKESFGDYLLISGWSIFDSKGITTPIQKPFNQLQK